MRLSAILLWRLCLSKPRPNKKPPMNRNIILLAYGAVASSTVKTPVNGNRTIGKSAVIAIGAASVIHQIIIQVAIPITFHASGFKSVLGLISSISAKRKGPSKRPKTFALRF